MSFLKAILLLFAVQGIIADKPCMPRQIQNQSVVCVCTEDYCDSLSRVPPESGGYVSYTSSNAGLRFQKSSGWLKDCDENPETATVITLDSKKTYQTINGFGGAVTDSTALNLRRLKPKLQKHFIESHFGDEGIGYSMVRVPIGGCDFSTHAYTYNDQPTHDVKLSNFSLTVEDLDFKIPFIRAAMSVSSTPIQVLGATWSPPVWMKTNHKIAGRSRLIEKYYQTYADYHLKFIDEYSKQGIPIWGISNGNEPFDGIGFPKVRLNDLGWDPEALGKWLSQNLGPTIRNSKYNATKILVADDQRLLVPIWFNFVIWLVPEALPYIDGIAVHWYANTCTSPAILSVVTEKHSDKFLISTEACNGARKNDVKVLLGSWERAENYVKDIIENIAAGFVGWIDWNMCLDPQGGPTYIKNYVDSPVIVTCADEFLKQPMHYGLGHFAKFVPRGSKRIDLSQRGDAVSAVAFNTPQQTVVAVLFNGNEDWQEVTLKLDSKQINLFVEPRSFTTVEINPESMEFTKK